jgi:hypothetical protein
MYVNLSRSFSRFALFFLTWSQGLVDMPEKLPVQEQVDDEQCCEYETCVIVHRDPLVTGNTQIGGPAASPSATFREDKIEHQPRDKRRDEGDQAADINKSVNGNAFQKNPSLSDLPEGE